ncbi:maestro heat-like repeat-containing protein family member 1 [Phyllostomus discolor]|uniref:Maestro heat-like repeat-containing protein family member 1 n=1 Tax=Phyllostomus discolor TaxID=89673 RepID=A0A7E6CZN8_9CHIR|nr:maestro heat-like repeat-containing protein family member 1 [Phyllostomus discolor]
MPAEVILPQRLLTRLVLFSQKPYRVKELGASSLRLLHALHPVIHSNVGQLWNQAIPMMLKILEDHSEEDLSQKEWEDRLFQFLSQSLVAIDDDNWLQQLVRVVLKMITSFNDDGDRDDKAFLYKFFGFSLRTSMNEEVIKMLLSALLHTSHEELQDREVRQSALAEGEHFQFERQAGKILRAPITILGSSSDSPSPRCKHYQWGDDTYRKEIANYTEWPTKGYVT